jgi:hypothetical protein
MNATSLALHPVDRALVALRACLNACDEIALLRHLPGIAHALQTMDRNGAWSLREVTDLIGAHGATEALAYLRDVVAGWCQDASL